MRDYEHVWRARELLAQIGGTEQGAVSVLCEAMKVPPLPQLAFARVLEDAERLRGESAILKRRSNMLKAQSVEARKQVSQAQKHRREQRQRRLSASVYSGGRKV
jgi:hypothetical protein